MATFGTSTFWADVCRARGRSSVSSFQHYGGPTQGCWYIAKGAGPIFSSLFGLEGGLTLALQGRADKKHRRNSISLYRCVKWTESCKSESIFPLFSFYSLEAREGPLRNASHAPFPFVKRENFLHECLVCSSPCVSHGHSHIPLIWVWDFISSLWDLYPTFILYDSGCCK